MKKLRKPYLSIFLASLVLFVSCTQYDTDTESVEQSFDYSIFLRLKNTSLKVPFPKMIFEIESINESNIVLINTINSKFKTQFSLDKKILDLGKSSFNEMLKKGLQTEIFSNVDIELLNNIKADLETSNFNTAILNLEKNVLKLNLPQQEFQKYNSFANILKLIHHANASIFDSTLVQRSAGGWACAGAILAHTLATISLGSCVTLIACPVAMAAWILSYANMINACRKEKKE